MFSKLIRTKKTSLIFDGLAKSPSTPPMDGWPKTSRFVTACFCEKKQNHIFGFSSEQKVRRTFCVIIIFGTLVLSLLTGCAGMNTARNSLHMRDTIIVQKGNTPYKVSDYRAYFHFIKGYEAEFTRNYPTAVEEYLLALKYDPKSFYLLFNLSRVLKITGDIQYSIVFAEKAIKVEPANKKALLFLADIFFRIKDSEKGYARLKEAQQAHPDDLDVFMPEVIQLSAEEKNAEAEELLTNLSAKFPDSHDLFYYFARIKGIENDFDKAIEYYNKAIAIEPDNTLSHLGLGMAYEAQKKEDKAIETYKDILENIDSNSSIVLDRLINIYVTKRDYKNALRWLDTLIIDKPYNINAKVKKGLIYIDKKDFSDSAEVWLDILETMPESVKFRSYLAYAYEQQEKYEKAKSEYEKMLKIDPYYADTYFHLGYLYGKMEQFGLSEKYLTEAIRLDSDKPEYYLYLGMNYINSEQLEKAERAFMDGLEVDINNSDLHFNLGALYEKMDNLNGLVAEMEAVLDQEPGNSHAMNYIGYMYAVKGIKLDKALEYVNKALEKEPDSGYFLDSLGWVNYKVGRYTEAEGALRKALATEGLNNDPVINEHMGYVLIKLKKMDEAKKFWNKSLVNDPENEKLIKTYKENGFGDPLLIDAIKTSLKNALKKNEEKKRKIKKSKENKAASI